MAQELDRDVRAGHVWTRFALPAARAWTRFALPAGVCALGVMMMHYPMIISGLARVQVDIGDSRLINYFLEHNYRWFHGDRNHAGIWDPPFFYPARNIAAHSDTMTATTPVYGAFRAAGLAPDTSFQFWMMTISILNYSVAFHLLYRRLRISVPAASVGAFLFAFGNARISQLNHQQLMPQFLGLIAVDSLFGLFSCCALSRSKRALLWMTVAAGVISQLTTGVYLGWFLVFSLGIAFLAALWLPTTRRPLVAVLRRDVPWIVMSAILGGLVLRNWISHESAAASELSSRYYPYVHICLPRPLSWLYLSPNSWLEGWSARLIGKLGMDTKYWDPCGVGLVTTAIGSGGLIVARDRRSVQLLVAVAVVLFLSVTVLPVGPLIILEFVIVQGTVAFAYFQRRTAPAAFMGVVGLVLLAANVDPFKEALQAVSFSTLAITLAAFTRWDGDLTGKLGLGGLLAGLILTLLPTPVLAVAVIFAGLAAAAVAVAGWRAWRQIQTVFLCVLVLSAALLTYWGQPAVFVISASALVALAALRRAPTWFHPSAWHVLSAAGFGLGLMVVFNDSGSAWHLIYTKVPGANALLFVSRVGLMMLIPWAIGLGLGLDALIARRRPLVALSLAIICLAEQAVPTASFDKRQNRDFVSSLAKRIDTHADAFYYSPRDSPYPSWKANLDAMWAGLECGVPTINGYSGGTPVGWRPLEDSNVKGPDDLNSLEKAIHKWKTTFGRSVDRVWWVGGPSDGWLDAQSVPSPSANINRRSAEPWLIESEAALARPVLGASRAEECIE